MEIAEILHQFERSNGTFPHAAVAAAVERREEIIPELLRIVEDTANRAKEIAADEDYLADFYAMFLLAQFRETRAYPLMLRIATLPAEVADSLLAFFITDSLDRVLASVCDGELEGIKSIVEDRNANEWARSAALRSLMLMVRAGKQRREEIIAYFAQLFRGKLEREYANVWNVLVCCCCDLGAEELIADIRRAYAKDLVDPSYISLEDVANFMGKLTSTGLMVEDTVDEMSHWSCFKKEDRVPEPAHTSETPQFRPAPTFKRAAPKTGRNEPCPCGSGKKYKKCCGA